MNLKARHMLTGAKIELTQIYLKWEGNRLYRSTKPIEGYKMHPAFKQISRREKSVKSKKHRRTP